MHYSLGAMRAMCAKLEETAAAYGRISKAPQQHTAQLTRSWEAEIVETIRQLAEVVIYGDRVSDDAYFELFMERKMMATLVTLATLTGVNPAIQVQVLQTISILVQNLRHEKSLFLLLSSNHVNQLVERGEQHLSGDEETQANFVSLLKTISLRLDSQTVQFFLDDAADCFPLHDCALRYIEHREPMTRASALTTVLNIYRIDDPHARCFVQRESTLRGFIEKFLQLVSSEVDGLASAIGRDKARAGDATQARADRLEDALDYARDVLSLDVAELSATFEDALLKEFVQAKLLRALEHEHSSPPTATAAALAATIFFRMLGEQHMLASSAFASLAEALIVKGVRGGETAYEPLAVASLLALNAGRRCTSETILAELGLDSTAPEARRVSCGRARVLLDDLVQTPDRPQQKMVSLFDDDEDNEAPAISEQPQRNASSSSLRAKARLSLAACLDRDFRVCTLELAAHTLRSINRHEDENSCTACQASIKTSVSAAATKLLAQIDETAPDRFLTQLAASRLDKDTDQDGQCFATRLRPPDALFGSRESRHATDEAIRGLIVLCDALDPTLAIKLAARLDDAQNLTVDNAASSPVAADLAGRKCLACSVLRALPNRPNIIKQPAQQFSDIFCHPVARDAPPRRAENIAFNWLDLYLVLDDARLLLAVPDPLALPKGRVLSSVPLHAAITTIDPHNGTKLDVLVYSRLPVGLAVHESNQRQPSPSTALQEHSDLSAPKRYRLSLVFESEKNCRLAHDYLCDRRAIVRANRLDYLRRRLTKLVQDPALIKDQDDDFPNPPAGNLRR